jgi:RHS repeat-associated protein
VTHSTGKERDSESNLDMFGARYFTSSMGRFMTPDWATRPTAVPYAVFGDPQSLNLYGYVRNDPVSRADADGHQDSCLGSLTCSAHDGKLPGGTAQNAAAGAAAAPTLVEVGEAALAAAANKLLTVAGDVLGVAADAASVPAMVLLTPTQLNSDENAQMAKIHAAEDNAEAPLTGSEHKNKARPSTEEDHQYGQARKKKDQGGEKGDEARREKGMWPRRPPGGKQPKGGWPPKPQDQE